LFNEPIAHLQPVNGGSIFPLAEGLRLITALPQWSYSLMGRLRPQQESVRGAVILRVRLKVEEGAVGVGVSAVGSTGDLIREADVEAAAEMQDVLLEISDGSLADSIIIRNRSPNGQSRVVVYSVDVFRPAGVLAETKGLGPLLFNVPVVDLKPTNGARASPLAAGLHLITASPQWAYSLVDNLGPKLGSLHGAIVLRMRFDVEEGSIGVGVSAVDKNGSLIEEVGLDAAPEEQVVDLDIPDASAVDSLIIRNQSPNGPSRVVVHSVDVLRLN
jgi:hypothetical protein